MHLSKSYIRLFSISLLFSAILSAGGLCADNKGLEYYSNYEDRIEWFRNAKFGIFIHWGLYSQIGYTEWGQDHFEIQPDDYDNLMTTFNPAGYDPKEWAELFKNAGAKYVVITSKHHEGFSMYETQFSDYNIMNSPCGKDVIQMLKDECVDAGLKFGIYYSVMDWHHFDYLPRRFFDQRSAVGADPVKYRQFFKDQVGELIDKYHPAVLWFDGEWENTFDSLQTVEIVDMMFTKNPRLIFNNRLSRFGYGDFKTPENQVPPTGLFKADGTPEVWETCSTMGDGWGYDPFADYFYSSRDLIRMLIDICSKGGNLLLNVGPTPEGKIRSEHKERLEAIGNWLKINGESIYGSQASVFEKLPFFGRSTTKGNTVYLQVFMKPNDNILQVPVLNDNILSAVLLDGNIGLDYRIENNQILIMLTEKQYDIDAFVIKLELDGPPSVKDYTPCYPQNETIFLDGSSAEIVSRQGHLADKVQCYDKILVKNWNADNSDIHLKWDFSTLYDGKYKLVVRCAGERELIGDISAQVCLDSAKIDFKIAERPRWTSVYKYLYDPYEQGELFIKAGKHNLCFKADSLVNKQSLIFRDIQLIPVGK